MSAPQRPRRKCKAFDEHVIARIVEADRSPAQLAGELEMSLFELSEWATQPSIIKALEALARLSDVRTQMLLSQYRANAAIRLIEIALAKEPTEASRRACVDLLRADLDVFEQTCQPTGESQDAAPPSEETILAALERLGEQQP